MSPASPALQIVPDQTVTVTPIQGRLAHKLAEAQGHAFADIAADVEAMGAMQVGQVVDRRRDDHNRQAVRFFSLILRDPTNAVSYATLGRGHLLEAIRLDAIKDEHDAVARSYVDESMAAGRRVVDTHEQLLRGRPGGSDDAA